MAINWYPGHMVTARKEAAEALRSIDVVIEVLDARVPRSSCNPEFEALRRHNQRPALKLLNKADVADPARTQAWLAHYNAQPGVRAIALSARKRGDVAKIPSEALALAPTRTTRIKPLRMMILGIPNVGKSTLMNTLLGRRLADVGDEPAITKHVTRYELGPTMSLVDTPGMMWKGVAQDIALKLAATHSIGRNAYDDASVAFDLARLLLADYPGLLEARYGALPAGPAATPALDGPGLIAAIATRRALVMRGGGPDLERAASLLLKEFRDGTLGAITLETP